MVIRELSMTGAYLPIELTSIDKPKNDHATLCRLLFDKRNNFFMSSELHIGYCNTKYGLFRKIWLCLDPMPCAPSMSNCIPHLELTPLSSQNYE